MSRKILISILLAAMLVLAGCSGPTDTQSPTQQPNNTDGQIGPSELNASTQDRHEAALQNAGSFKATSVVAMKSNNSSAMTSDLEITTNYAVNFTSDRAYSSSGGLLGVSETYTAGDTTYKQQKMDANTSDKDAHYATASAPYNESGGSLGGGVSPVNTTEAMGGHLLFTENVTYERVGTDTVNGTKVAVFKAEGQSAIEELESTMSEDALKNSSIDDFVSTVKVDDNGVVRYQHVSMTYTSQGQQATVELTHRVTAVGETTVDEPSWLKYAKDKAE